MLRLHFSTPSCVSNVGKTSPVPAAPERCHWIRGPAECCQGGCSVCSLRPGVRVGSEGAEAAVRCCGGSGSFPNRQPLYQQQVTGSSHYHDRRSNRYTVHRAPASKPAQQWHLVAGSCYCAAIPTFFLSWGWPCLWKAWNFLPVIIKNTEQHVIHGTRISLKVYC